MEVWFTIPKRVNVDRKNGEEVGAKIEMHYDGTHMYESLGLNGGLTMPEIEDLQWRLKQAAQVIKTGKIGQQHA